MLLSMKYSIGRLESAKIKIAITIGNYFIIRSNTFFIYQSRPSQSILGRHYAVLENKNDLDTIVRCYLNYWLPQIYMEKGTGIYCFAS